MSPPKTRAAPEKVIEDKDILRQDHLFPEESTKVVADKTAAVKFPQYVRIQRQRRILAKRLKVPPAINHFSHTLDKAAATQLFKLLEKYHPESKAEKKARVKVAAEKTAQTLAPTESKKAQALVHGIKNVTALIESKKAALVVIAHDVDPIELVVWLPPLCRKLNVPYCIVKSKSRLGQVVGMDNTSCIAIAEVKAEDRGTLSKIVDTVNTQFLARFKEEMHKWGGGELSEKTMAKLRAQGKLNKE